MSVTRNDLKKTFAWARRVAGDDCARVALLGIGAESLDTVPDDQVSMANAMLLCAVGQATGAIGQAGRNVGGGQVLGDDDDADDSVTYNRNGFALSRETPRAFEGAPTDAASLNADDIFAKWNRTGKYARIPRPTRD